MSTDGILEYQGTKRVLFRGDTSNIVFDTRTTSLGIGVTGSNNPSSNLYITGNAYVSSNLAIGGMSIEIGAGNTSHTSNLHFECNHDANVASIKLNSNVTTEFSRSKKLIKYPRVAMTQNDESGTSGYVTNASTWENQANNETYGPWNNFNGILNDSAWQSYPRRFSQTTGDWDGTTTAPYAISLVGGTTIYGEWVELKIPNKIQLHTCRISPLTSTTYPNLGKHRSPRSGYILGRVGATGNWTILKSWSDVIDGWEDLVLRDFDIENPSEYYDYFRVVWTAINGNDNYSTSAGAGYASSGEIEFLGLPEYDPEAYGTDVTIKSKANVPNTDFLDVFVDAGNTNGYSLSGSSVTSVTDLSSPANTVSVTGVTYDSTNKAFVFSGSSSSYIKATLANGNGNYAHTLSAWFMMTDYSGSWRNIIALGTSFTNNQSSIAYDPDQDQLYYGTYGADIYVSHKPELNKWYHVAATFSGGSTTSTTMNIYLNGVNMGGVPNGTQTPSFTGNQLCIGGAMNTNGVDANNPFKGQIANARFYRREYSPGEIYQLYAYQKEYFGHGDLSMTLKAGRLGIGTSEPRAALDVKGVISFTEKSFDLRNVSDAQWPASAGYPTYSGDNIGSQFMWRTLGSGGGTYFNYHVPRNGILMVNVTMIHRILQFRAGGNTTHAVYWCLRKSTDNGATWNALTSHLIGHRWINSSGWDQEWHPVAIPFTGRVNEGDQVALFVQNEYTQSGSTYYGNFQVYDCRMRGILI